MELRVLKYFLMVAREENITKAAIAFHQSEYRISAALRRSIRFSPQTIHEI